MSAPALLGRHPQTGTGQHIDPETRERVERLDLADRPSPAHAAAYHACKAAERRAEAARARVDELRRELAEAIADAQDLDAYARRAWEEEQRAAFGE